MLTVAALPLNAATVVVRTGTSTGALAFEGISALAVGWTQASGASFTAGSITATVHSVIGTATGTAYLTNSLGVSASNVVASVPFSVSSLTPTTITLFSGLTLPAGTYFLTIANASLSLAWDFVGGGAPESLGTGVTSTTDSQDNITHIPPIFPPSATSFVPATAGGSSKVLLFAVTGTPAVTALPTGVPTLGTWALLTTALLLTTSGLLLTRRGAQA